MRVEVKEGDNLPYEDGDHEVCFLEVGTDDGFITISNHNEHNGYYGGSLIPLRPGAQNVVVARAGSW